ncbi:hypothetical protein [Rhodoblastus sp.]|uniref:hypothetical protein n=1 Tax=Rhodoblastus sp. TaxID=1962975 RepID=UPI003F949DE0
MLPAAALADDCLSNGSGTTNCTGNPATFPNGGALANSGDTTLAVGGSGASALTGNIQPSNNVAGASLVISPGAAGGGSSYPVHGGSGDGGSSTPNVTITLQSPSTAFQVNTNGAPGVIAESVGQAGGQGGTGYSVFPLPGYGGRGGDGGGGGAVSVTLSGSGSISTSGDNQHGVRALSQGGAGGHGGDGDTLGSTFGSGGDGGQGGAPNDVTVTDLLDPISKGPGVNITTTGVGAAGVWAQSVGAPGGDGGTVSGCIACTGGTGAAASSGGTVTVDTNATITTHANSAMGIFAQSVGGFAGSGGGSIGLLSFGGGTSSAGDGGVVQVTTDGGAIDTSGVGASGIFAQSAGGGGGAGGGSGGLVGFGGGGGSGGSGQKVTVTNHATMNIGGDFANGIFAQSVGGGGGTAGFGAGVVGVGGSGGGAANGGDVTVQNYGTITLTGTGGYTAVPTAAVATTAYGIFEQSIGGGGGDGALGAGAFGIGGQGGAAGDGQKVEVDNFADIKQNCAGSGCTAAGAIFAQSIGGGGGNGGGGAGIFGMGASGSGGGNGGALTVNSTAATLLTHGTFSNGVLAQSIGGGGGNGGWSGGLVSIGGSGAKGGTGDTVSVTTTGQIATIGDNSAAILAQSIGGGGGNGGGSGGLAAIGGGGGAGGDANTVTVNNSAGISTGGQFSDGIFAQSIGGGGGNGGFAVGVGLFVSVGVGGNGGVAGNGGAVCVNSSIGPCSDSLGAATPTIQTSGDHSTAILAQSIGGGGGNGGWAVSASVGFYADISIGVGGKGGAGGHGGDVYVGGAGTIITGSQASSGANPGAFSDGIDAESIGGGGGNGGFTVSVGISTGGALSLGFGGNGGAGNYGGAVTVNTSENVTTYGDQAVGVFARSIGGGGGNGGFSVSVAGSPYASVGLSFGGGGANGGYGGDVSVDNSGSITTYGALSNGITAQSIGGGGGNGGFSVSAAVTLSSTSASAGLSFGGNGGDGGYAGTVHVGSTGDINTSGAGADGILAQSIGGGGGNGGFAGAVTLSAGAAFSDAVGGGAGGCDGSDPTKCNHGGKVDVTSNGSITTAQANASGIVAQSIGGGGGNGGFSLSVAATLNSMAIGKSTAGNGGSGGFADTVSVTSTGTIQTGGALAYGILAQSIGGGGGNGGFAIGGALSDSGSATGNSVGGAGGDGNYASAVTVTTYASPTSSIPGTVISTTGAGSIGILAQSIGGGGGNGGFSINFNASVEDSAGDNSLGATGAAAGTGGAGSNGGTVTVNNNGKIVTTGNGAHGIVAQSIGGGGGDGGFAISGAFSAESDASSNAVGGAGGDGGKSDVVTVTNKGDISVGGDMADGIVAQSIGGGGGNGGFSIAGTLSLGGKAASNSVGGAAGGGGAGGEVDVYNYNAIQVGGANSVGIVAQSIGGGGGNGGFSVGASGAVNGSDGVTDAIGGAGGNGGAGGVVNVYSYAGASIETQKDMDIGILAQSIGGGGGNGGFTVSGTYSSSGDATTTVGGSCDSSCQSSATGGGGGAGNTVTVDNFGSIKTHGSSSIGIEAQSIGGGGGNGGFAGALSVSTGGDTSTAVGGGAGGNGGAGDTVTVTNESTGDIHTYAANSVGILAQSIGGGGGNGGFALSGGAATSGDSNTQSVGGSGGMGGTGGTVMVTNNGKITTEQVLSTAIVAQSIGGGGGNGGFSVAGTYDSGSGGTTSNVGGTGGNGGDGGTVQVTNSGSIKVEQAGSTGILAQSIGGGGGNGGFAIAASISDGKISNNVGGTGGNGGNGGDVTVISTGSITATGANSVGVIAQSIGGGGGAGGFSIAASSSGNTPSADVNIGDVGVSFGVAGTAGAKGTVTVQISGGEVHTTGMLSPGAVIQSIAGGGGIGGLAVGDPMNLGASNLQVGAVNGLSGDALTALTPSNSSPIVTDMAGSPGLVVQSIGGGGGVGQIAGDYNLTGGALAAIVGGSGANGGGGNVSTPTNSGDVTTNADNSIGLLAQSIGGGGGLATFSFGTLTGSAASVTLQAGGSQTAVGAGMDASYTTSGALLTKGSVSPGVLAQSIGGGGGVDGFVAATGISVTTGLNVDLGGTGGGGGGAGKATATAQSGTVETDGLVSPAMIAQSIGGGGGFAGYVNAGSSGTTLLSSQLGATGGGGGSALTATVSNAAAVTTEKAGSIGLVAQSIGGGGGLAIAYGVAGAGPVTLGASGGPGGNGGDVSASTTGTITTSGVDAFGVLAQSVGGGGGTFLAFDTTGAAVAPTVSGAAGSGNSGNVDVQLQAAVTTTGAGADGVVAQSVAGGGGVVGGGVFASTLGTAPFAGSAGGTGTAGTVNVNAQANVSASGADATAIYAESIDHTGLGKTIAVTLGNAATGTAQTVSGGTGAGNGVAIAGGSANPASPNTLTNYATLTTQGDINGMTVAGGAGDESVTSYGHLIGSVDLGGGVNSLDNKPYGAVASPTAQSGVFDSGATVDLGAGNLFTNEGVLSPGKLLNVFTTNETGNFLQTGTAGACGAFGAPNMACGYLATDLDFNYATPANDRLNVTGTANLGGAVLINLLQPGRAQPGVYDVTLISAEPGGATLSGAIVQNQPTAVATYGLTDNGTNIDLHYAINFAPAGLTQNQMAIGNTINAIQTAHVGTFENIAAAIFYQPTVAALGNVYNSISGEGVAETEQTAFAMNDRFQSAVMREMGFWLFDDENNDPNAKVLGGSPLSYVDDVEIGHPAFASPMSWPQPRTWRAWATMYGGNSSNPANPYVGSAATNENDGGAAFGLDYQLDPHAIVGVAGAYSRANFGVLDRATTGSVEGGQIALYGMARGDNAYLAGMLGGDFYSNKEMRVASIPGTVLPPLFGTLTPAIGGFNENPAGAFASNGFSGQFETGYRNRLGAGVDLTPFAGVQFAVLRMDGFTETNAGQASTIGLTYMGRTISSVPTFLGAQLSRKIDLGDGMNLSLWVRAAWKHEFEPLRSIEASFIAAPGFDFVVHGASAITDMARVDAGMKVAVNKNLEFFASFDGDFAPQGRDIAGMGGVRVNW